MESGGSLVLSWVMNVATTETWIRLQLSSQHTESEASQGPVTWAFRVCGVRNKWGEGPWAKQMGFRKACLGGIAGGHSTPLLQSVCVKVWVPWSSCRMELSAPAHLQRKKVTCAHREPIWGGHASPACYAAWVVSGSWRRMCLSWETHMRWMEQKLACTLASPFSPNPVCLRQYRGAFIGQLLHTWSWILVRREVGERGKRGQNGLRELVDDMNQVTESSWCPWPLSLVVKDRNDRRNALSHAKQLTAL